VSSFLGPLYFDLIALERDGRGYLLRFIQAKGTDVNYKTNARVAAEKLGKLDAGRYQARVTNVLYYVALEARQQNLDVDIEALRSLQLQRDRRRYTIFVVHEPELSGPILTKFKDHISGNKERREAIFMRFRAIHAFLFEMEASIRARIS